MPRGVVPPIVARTEEWSRGRPSLHCVCFPRARGGVTAAGIWECVCDGPCVLHVHVHVHVRVSAHSGVGPLLARQGL